MNKNKKHISCSKCLEQVLEIQDNSDTKAWEKVGNGWPQCGPCRGALKQKSFQYIGTIKKENS